MTVNGFIRKLRYAPNTPGIFNPWYQTDVENDCNKSGPKIRRAHLRAYFSQRVERARYVLMAEAVGYQGAHFSGVPMTSERLLLGHLTDRDVRPEHAFTGLTPKRTSSPQLRANGFSEPTATIVWSAIRDLNIDPYDVVLWNIFPWHPYKPDEHLLTNRTPTRSELDAGLDHLHAFLKLFGDCRILAVGRKSEGVLQDLNIACKTARHPANGGASRFRAHFEEFVKQD